MSTQEAIVTIVGIICVTLIVLMILNESNEE